MVEAEEDPARRGRHAPPQRRQLQQQQLRQHPQARTSSSGRVAAPQSRLHNFPLPSNGWGNQRLLRCMKVESHGEPPANSLGSSSSPLSGRRSVADKGGKAQRARDREAVERERDGKEEEEEEERLDKFRNSMMAEFRKAFDRIPLPPPPPPQPSRLLLGEQKEVTEKCTTPTAASTAEAAKPWNLRLRRAACNAPSATAENVKMRSSPSAPEKNLALPAKYSLRSDAGPSQDQEERPKFSAVLSKEEIEEDYFAMTGTKPSRRPKKRPRNVQRQLEGVYPGFYLTEVTPELYKITEEK